jgi:cell division protein FtsB
MKAFHSSIETKKNSFFHSWFFLVILVVLLGLFVRSTYASFHKKNTAEKEEIEFRNHMDNLHDKKQRLEGKIDTLQTDRGLEEEFRKRFNVIKEGETMIRIVQ